MNDFDYMKEAIAEAKLSLETGDVPVGAVIVKDGKIISRAHNTREKNESATGHAELLAIEEACRVLGRWRLSDCKLYVTLEPCPMCAGAIINASIGEVICSLKDSKAGAFGSVINFNSYPLNHKVKITYGVMQNESRTLLQNFFSKLRNN